MAGFVAVPLGGGLAGSSEALGVLGEAGHVRLLDLRTRAVSVVFRVAGEVAAAAFQADGTQIVATGALQLLQCCWVEPKGIMDRLSSPFNPCGAWWAWNIPLTLNQPQPPSTTTAAPFQL